MRDTRRAFSFLGEKFLKDVSKVADLKISDIQIMPIVPRDGLVAIASFIINECLFVGDVAIFTSFTNPLGFRLLYPDKILKNGKRINCVHPITKEAGQVISEAVIDEYKKLMAKLGERRNIY